MQIMRVIALFLILGFFSSCSLSMSKKEKTENVLTAPSIEKSIVSSLNDPLFQEGAWPAKNWWEVYGLEELNALMAKAVIQNPTLQAAKERIEVAKNNSTIAHSKLLPLIYFNASDQWQYISENGLYRALNPTLPLNNQQIDFSLSFFYEFDFWGKYRNLYHAALSRAWMAFAEESQANLVITTALAQSYFALRTNLLREKLYKELLNVRRDFFELQSLMLKNSLYSLLTPLLSEEKVFEAEQFVFDIEKEVAVGYHIVNILAGSGPDEPLACEEPLLPLLETLAIPTQISAELLARRPDLVASRWRMEAFAHEVGAAKADFFPNINIAALAGFQSGSWTSIFASASKTVGILPALALPLYTAGAIKANVGAKKALFNEAVYQYNDLILKSLQQVSDLLAITRSVYKEKEQQVQIVENATLRYDLTLLRQESGIDNALNALQMLEELIGAELKNIELLYQQYVASISLTKALGGGYYNVP